jgi:homoserine kinase type II
VPDDHLLRSVLRDQWHLAPTGITDLPRGLMSRSWDVAAGDDRYVVRLVPQSARPGVEAGLAAADHLRGRGIAAGEPVRTLTGGLIAETPDGSLAVLRRTPGRPLVGADPVDQQWWGDRLGAVHRALQHFHHPGLRPWSLLEPDAAHLGVEAWLRAAVTDAVTATTRLTVTDRLTYGVLHGDPAPTDFVVDPQTGRAGLLDCPAGGTGPLVSDVAAAVVYAGGADASAELLDGYLAAGPVHSDELHAALPVLVRLRWAAVADWAARRLAADAGPDCARDVLRHARAALESGPA